MRRHWPILLVLTIVTAGLYWPVHQHGFVLYDDPDYITANPVVQEGLSWKGVQWAFGQIHAEKTYWHPVTWLSHMVDCELFGVRPGPHHLVNVLLHTVNVLLLFLVLWRITGSTWRSAVVAAFFAWHPLQVDTVAWVTERKNLLSTLFWILTLLTYAQYATRLRPSTYLLSLLLFCIGLMCKPVLVTLPCVMLLLDVWPLRRISFAGIGADSPADSPRHFQPVSIRRAVLEKLPYFLVAIGICALTITSHAGLGITQASSGLPFGLRVENALVSYARYLGKTVWPANLAVLYPHPGAWPPLAVYGSMVLLIALSGWILWNSKRLPYLLVGWLWFIGVLVPAIGLLQIGVQAMADRFAYVPLIGLFIGMVWGFGRLAEGSSSRLAVASATTVVLLAACVVASRMQLRVWHDSVSLFEHAVEVTQDNFVMHNNLAYALAAEDKVDPAIEHLHEALQIRPNYAEAHLQLAELLQRKQKFDQAIVHYQTALGLKPGWIDAAKGLAEALAQAGQLPQAIAKYRHLVRVLPRDIGIRMQLAVLLCAGGETRQAIEEYQQILNLNQKLPVVLNNLAWIYATHPETEFRDGAKAVDLAEQASQLTGHKTPLLLGTLAAAYAEAGRFDHAIRATEQAIALAEAAGQSNVVEAYRGYLSEYRSRKPHREKAAGSPLF